MNKAGIVKKVVTALTIVAFLAPIIYGLSANRWDLLASVAPQYVPPRVGFETGRPTIVTEGLNVSLSFPVTNTGEVRVSILSIDAQVYTIDRVLLGTSRLVEPLVLSQGESKTATLRLNLDEGAVRELLPYLMIEGQATIFFEGETRMSIFSSEVIMPFSMSFTFSASELGVTP